ncbi:hypothetical protein DRJ78_06565 [Enterococcus faecalis]|nr:hypothetical protein DRJ78_06565 [Enterococcus faecalis]
MKKITERPIVKILIKILMFALCFYAGIKFVDFIFPLVGFKQEAKEMNVETSTKDRELRC